MPFEKKCKQYKKAISDKFPSLSKVGMVGDGMKILIQKSGNNRKQNAFYWLEIGPLREKPVCIWP